MGAIYSLVYQFSKNALMSDNNNSKLKTDLSYLKIIAYIGLYKDVELSKLLWRK